MNPRRKASLFTGDSKENATGIAFLQRFPMKRVALLLGLAVLIPVIVIASGRLPGLALAEVGGGASTSLSESYDLTWNTVDGGGGTFSHGGGYGLGGTAGQPDAGVLAGGGYSLSGGFWCGVPAGYRLYLPLVLREYH